MRERPSRKYARKLVHFSIVHSEQEMGRFAPCVKRLQIQRFGPSVPVRKAQALRQFWHRAERSLASLDPSRERVRLYQDGLPVCGREREIVEDLARKGSLNHRLLLKLIERGAVLMGTESPGLLELEYRLAEASLEGKKGKGPEGADLPDPEDLLKRRDAFIARRINNTLLPGETGAVFLGALHSLDGLLDADVEVRRPLGGGV